MPEDAPIDEKQCRICLDGPEAEFELGRLIRPCLCKGSISVCCIVHDINYAEASDGPVRSCKVPSTMAEYVPV